MCKVFYKFQEYTKMNRKILLAVIALTSLSVFAGEHLSNNSITCPIAVDGKAMQSIVTAPQADSEVKKAALIKYTLEKH